MVGQQPLPWIWCSPSGSAWKWDGSLCSYVGPDKLRFDFTHGAALSDMMWASLFLDYRSAAERVPDEMAETFVVCGTPDEVRRKIEPIWKVADSLTLVPPAYGLPGDRVMAYVAAIAGTFYA